MNSGRALRVFLGLGVMAVTVTAVGSIGAARPEPPSDHGATSKAAPAKTAKPAAKQDAINEPRQEPKGKSSPAEGIRLEPVWNDPSKNANSGRTEPGRIEQSSHPVPVQAAAAHAGSVDEPPSPDDALNALRSGNARWAAGQPQSPNISESRRRALAEGGQHPIATVLTCADSRIPVERVFDQGVGDLFVVRVAGNIAGAHEAGTIEYGAEHLHVPVLIVMGHTKCGAVGAAASHAKVEGNVHSLIKAIAPAVERAESLNPTLKDAELVSAAVRENVWQSVFDLIKSSAVCRERIRAGELRVVGAVYDIGAGTVEWLGEHPWQRELIAAMDARHASHQAEVPESH